VTVALARRALADGTLARTEIFPAAFVAACKVLAMADRHEALAIYDEALAEAHRRGSILTFGVT
jgi:hypothetical protein